jgi:hypothetical protein
MNFENEIYHPGHVTPGYRVEDGEMVLDDAKGTRRIPTLRWAKILDWLCRYEPGIYAEVWSGLDFPDWLEPDAFRPKGLFTFYYQGCRGL